LIVEAATQGRSFCWSCVAFLVEVS